jgi:formate dehydrogenase subunit gamma
MIVFWARNMLFARGDAAWLTGFGGHFGRRGALPAGKFNAGQKVYFWILSLGVLTMLETGSVMAFLRNDQRANLAMVYTVHDLAALLVLLLVISHVYLGVVLSPHSLRSIFGEDVSRQWLREHHPEDPQATGRPE